MPSRLVISGVCGSNHVDGVIIGWNRTTLEKIGEFDFQRACQAPEHGEGRIGVARPSATASISIRRKWPRAAPASGLGPARPLDDRAYLRCINVSHHRDLYSRSLKIGTDRKVS